MKAVSPQTDMHATLASTISHAEALPREHGLEEEIVHALQQQPRPPQPLQLQQQQSQAMAAGPNCSDRWRSVL